jgi:dinuclear metal center YbgI/SA1388 family protein
MIELLELTRYLDAYLRIREIPDEPNAVNGLQVENAGRVGRIIAAVDASQETIASCGAGEPPLLLVHHGLFWEGNVPLTGRRMRRVRALLSQDAALYAAHIPLDVHPDVGNNAVLARRLSMQVAGWFAAYRGVQLGVWGEPPDDLRDRAQLAQRLGELLGTDVRLLAGGPARVGRLGIITGAGGTMVSAARDAGLDSFVTGEGPHHTYFDAMEWGINLLYAGHYATEQVGVQALAAHVGERFGLPWEFHHHPTGL